MKDLTGALSMLKQYEGSILYMYRDSRGYVTVGVGFLLDSAEGATKYTFYLNAAAAAQPPVVHQPVPPKPAKPGPTPAGKAPYPQPAIPSVAQKATADQIKAEWTSIKSKATPHPAKFYEKFTTMKMLQGDIDAALTTKINSFEGSARQTFSDWDDFASPAQLALLDMIYNLGSLSDFPKLVNAANKKDWATCAAECHREGPKDQRNNDTRDRFLAAAKEQPLTPPSVKPGVAVQPTPP